MRISCFNLGVKCCNWCPWAILHHLSKIIDSSFGCKFFPNQFHKIISMHIQSNNELRVIFILYQSLLSSFIFWICSLFMFHHYMYFDLDQCTNFFYVYTYEVCPKLYTDKWFSLIKFKIITCESILDMKDCNREELTKIIVEPLHFHFWKSNPNSI